MYTLWNCIAVLPTLDLKLLRFAFASIRINGHIDLASIAICNGIICSPVAAGPAVPRVRSASAWTKKRADDSGLGFR